ncbi:MAG: 5-formyltetrahydrofolate cyclo-ligase [Verrucomicrobia bacterium]|nr:5-formyltetrahydrofolate cyclo-ligase [Verrucomicrobiota bacterium]
MTAAPSNLFAEKRALRERVLALRGALSADEVARRSRQIAMRLLALPAVREAQTIFCYLSHGNEVQTHQLVRDWLAAGKHIHVPAYHAEQRRYQPSHICDLERDLAAGKLGILEPHTRRTPDRPADVAIVPGVAFDAQGHRLGYGKGFYDEMLKHFGGLKIAVAFDCQIQPSVPHAPKDVPMDVVVAENAVYWREHA